MSRIIILFIMVSLLITSCGGGVPGPDDTVIEWWDALVKPDRNRLSELTCGEKKAKLEMAMNMLAVWTDVIPGAVGGYLGIGGIDTDMSTSDLKAKILEQDDHSALVQVTGSMRLSAMGISGTEDFSYSMRMVKENDGWRVCDDIVDAIVEKITGMDQLGITIPDVPIGTPTPSSDATLTVEQAVEATIAADKAIIAASTQVAILALTPTATHTPEPLSAEEQQNAIATALARATVTAKLAEIEPDMLLDEGRGKMSPNHRIIVSRDIDIPGEAYNFYDVLWNLDTGLKFKLDPESNGGLLQKAYFSPDSTMVGIGRNIWRIKDGELLTSLENKEIELRVFSPDNQYALFYTEEGFLLKNISSSEPGVILGGEFRYGTPPVFSPNGNLLAAALEDYTITLWSIPDGSLVEEFTGHEYSVGHILFSDDGRRLITSSWNNDVRLWNVDEGSLIASLTPSDRISSSGIGGDLYSIALNSEKGVGATWGGYMLQRTLKLFDILTGQELGQLGTDEYGGGPEITFSPDGELIATLLRDNVVLWDTESGIKLAEFQAKRELSRIQFSEDATSLVGYVETDGVGTITWPCTGLID